MDTEGTLDSEGSEDKKDQRTEKAQKKQCSLDTNKKRSEQRRISGHRKLRGSVDTENSEGSVDTEDSEETMFSKNTK